MDGRATLSILTQAKLNIIKMERMKILMLAAAQSLVRRALEDSRSHQHLTKATENKHCKQINKQYTKQYLMTKKMVPTDATRHYKHMSA
jgi:hypothetical protein